MKLEAELQDSKREGIKQGIKQGRYQELKNSIEMMRDGGLSDTFIFDQIKKKHPNTFTDKEIQKLMKK